MSPFWQKLKATVLCFKLAFRISGLVGGIEALASRLSGLEKEILSGESTIRCDQCGSTELEPTGTRPWRDGVEVCKYRCKACGQEVNVP